MYTIGEFSIIAKVTTKMLRHYDKISLLKLSFINPENGYRYYTKNQVHTILLINKLKKYHFSLQEIKDILNNYNSEQLIKLLDQKIKEISKQIYENQVLIAQLTEEIDKLKNGGDMMMPKRDFEVNISEQKLIHVVSLRKTINMDDIGTVVDKVFEIIHTNGLEATGEIMTRYFDKDFDHDNADIEVCVPVNTSLEKVTKKFGVFTCAHTTFTVTYSELGEAYAYLMDWIKEKGYEIIEAPFEKYIKGPESSASPKEYITEVYFPIKK